MSIKERSKSLERKVVAGSKTAGRDVKRGVVRAGRKIERAGKKVGTATRHGLRRAENRVRTSRRAKA
jgi:hypothetical protein